MEKKLKVSIAELNKLRMYVNNKTLKEKNFKDMDTLKFPETRKQKKSPSRENSQNSNEKQRLRENEINLLQALQEHFGVKIEIPKERLEQSPKKQHHQTK